MNESLFKYVKIYDNVIPEEYCNHLIEKFHANPDAWEYHDNETFIFNQINLPNHKVIFEAEIAFLMEVFEHYVNRYAYDCKMSQIQMPENYGFEAIRMKYYKADHGEFKPHIDACDLETIKRFLVFFLYLDEGDGGETALYDQEVAVQRKPGRLLMFPPMWTYPHAGLMPKGTDKHIIGSYLHYVE